jgi:hypothetical protein
LIPDSCAARAARAAHPARTGPGLALAIAAIVLMAPSAAAAAAPHPGAGAGLAAAAPGVEADQWNLWSDVLLAHLDGGHVHPALAHASSADRRVLARQARFSLQHARSPAERRSIEAVRDLLIGGPGTLARSVPESRAGIAVRAPIVADEYFPMKVGHTWWMKDANTSEEFTLSIVGMVPVNGTRAWKMKRSRANNQEEWDATVSDANGVFLHVRYIRGNNAVLAPPVQFAKANVVLGEVYTTTPSFANPATGNKTVWTTRCEKLEDIAVPAGSFKGCLKVNMTIKDAGLGTALSKIDLWVAPRVGFVKRVGQFFGVFFVETLQKYQHAP